MKKQSYLFILMLLTSTILATGQVGDYNNVLDENVNLPYHFVNINGEMNVVLIQDSQPGVSVEGSYFGQLDIYSRVSNDTLYVYQANALKEHAITNVAINVNEMISLEVVGKSKVTGEGFVNADYLTLKAREGAEISLDVRALKVDTWSTRNSSIILNGTAAEETESSDGDGIIDISHLKILEPGVGQRYCPGC